jgi:hypothetical protein
VRAGNTIGDAGAASLAPSLGRMTQLTSLNLGGSLRASGAAGWEQMPANAGCVVMALRVAGCSVAAVVRGCSGWWDLGEASRGAAVRVGNGVGEDGAASLAPSLAQMAQLTSLDLFCTLRASAAAAL